MVFHLLDQSMVWTSLWSGPVRVLDQSVFWTSLCSGPVCVLDQSMVWTQLVVQWDQWKNWFCSASVGAIRIFLPSEYSALRRLQIISHWKQSVLLLVNRSCSVWFRFQAEVSESVCELITDPESSLFNCRHSCFVWWSLCCSWMWSLTSF